MSVARPSHKEHGDHIVLDVMEQHLLRETELYKTSLGPALPTLQAFIDLCAVTHVNLKALVQAYNLWLAADVNTVPEIVSYVEIESDSQAEKLEKLRTAIMTDYFLQEIQMRHSSGIIKKLVNLEAAFGELRTSKEDLQGYPSNVSAAVERVYGVSLHN